MRGGTRRHNSNKVDFKKRYDTLVEAYREAEARQKEVESQIEEMKGRQEKILRFIRQVEEQSELLTCFDPALWAAMVQEVTVGEDGKMTFQLTGGTEVEVPAQREEWRFGEGSSRLFVFNGTDL